MVSAIHIQVHFVQAFCSLSLWTSAAVIAVLPLQRAGREDEDLCRKSQHHGEMFDTISCPAARNSVLAKCTVK